MGRVWVVALLAACAGCSGEAENNGGGQDASSIVFDLTSGYDFARAPDLTAPPDGTAPPDFAGVSCGELTCAAGAVCCGTPSAGGVSYACASSCADGGLTIACDGPDNCRSGSATLCCATLLPSGGSAPLCNGTAIAECADSCTTQLPSSCNADPGTARLCHRAADCASDAQSPSCCLFSLGGRDVTFCAGAALKNLAVACVN